MNMFDFVRSYTLYQKQPISCLSNNETTKNSQFSPHILKALPTRKSPTSRASIKMMMVWTSQKFPGLARYRSIPPRSREQIMAAFDTRRPVCEGEHRSRRLSTVTSNSVKFNPRSGVDTTTLTVEYGDYEAILDVSKNVTCKQPHEEIRKEFQIVDDNNFSLIHVIHTLLKGSASMPN